MRLVFGCQARSLNMFYGLAHSMRAQGATVEAAYYVADSLHFGGFSQAHPDVLASPLLKEWEIMAEAAGRHPSVAGSPRLDAEYGDPTIWNTLLCDRRLVYGPRCTLRQDYRRRFSDQELMSIAEVGYEQVERFFDRVRPDAVVTFICVTFGEYMLQQVARRRGIPFLNLRPTRIGNFITYGQSVFEPSEPIRQEYDARRTAGTEDAWSVAAREYLAFVRERHARYEGVVMPGDEGPSQAEGTADRLVRVVRTVRAYMTGPARQDNHVPSPLAVLWFTRVANPVRASRNARILTAEYVAVDALPRLTYALFPLHYEPEVSLLVYGRPYVNQIEVIRAAARALPAGMVLLVKEHPVALKNRTLAYYRALLRIPNVRLLDPACPSRDAVMSSKIVITIAGSMGQEAAMLTRPVVLLGHAPYELLPSTMVRRAGIDGLPDAVAALLTAAHHDEAALVHFVAAVMSQSVRANLYSELLGRGGTRGDAIAGYQPTESMTALATHTLDRLRRAVAGG